MLITQTIVAIILIFVIVSWVFVNAGIIQEMTESDTADKYTKRYDVEKLPLEHETSGNSLFIWWIGLLFAFVILVFSFFMLDGMIDDRKAEIESKIFTNYTAIVEKSTLDDWTHEITEDYRKDAEEYNLSDTYFEMIKEIEEYIAIKEYKNGTT